MSARIKGLLMLPALFAVGLTQSTAALGIALGATGASSAPASSDGDDSYSPAQTLVTGTNSSRIEFTEGGGPFSCLHSVLRGTTPTTGLGSVPLSPPVFDNGSHRFGCDDPAQDEVTVRTSGTWTLRFVDAVGDESQTEPNSGDRLALTVPVGGMVIRDIRGCVRTVAPASPAEVFGTYDDHSAFHLNFVALPIRSSGPSRCDPRSMGTIFLTADYAFRPGLSDTS